jgi:hypothetical protein
MYKENLIFFFISVERTLTTRGSPTLSVNLISWSLIMGELTWKGSQLSFSNSWSLQFKSLQRVLQSNCRKHQEQFQSSFTPGGMLHLWRFTDKFVFFSQNSAFSQYLNKNAFRRSGYTFISCSHILIIHITNYWLYFLFSSFMMSASSKVHPPQPFNEDCSALKTIPFGGL